MGKTLAERAEEARLEEESRFHEQSNARYARTTQDIVDYFKQAFPDAVHLGDREFQLGDEIFIGNVEYLYLKKSHVEENRPQPKESWFTNFINWAKRYGK